MKKSISMVLCLAMLISVFSCLGLTASAAGDAQELFTVKASGLKNDKITYTVYLNKGVNLSGSIIYAKFDSDVLEIVKANSGAYMVDDGDGGERENIGGVYEADFMDGYDNQFSIAHAYYGQVSDYKAGSSNKPYMQFTFKVIDEKRPATTIRFYCYEFNSDSIPENNIQNGSSALVYKKEIKTLGSTVYKNISSTKNGVLITWKKTVGADEYEIFRNGTSIATVDGSVTSYEDKKVSNNVNYKYVVRAKNEAGNDYAAKEISTRYTVAPSKIGLSNADGKVVVKWSEVKGATSYRVYRRTISSSGTIGDWNYVSSKITKREFSDKTVKSGRTYEYAVRVYSKGGNSALYSGKKITYLATPDFSLEANTVGVKVSWNKVSGAESYRIYRKNSDGSWEKIKTVSSSTSYTDRKAPSGKKVYYLVKAVKGSYTSDYDKHSLTYLKTPVASVKNITTGVRVSWSKSSGATSYDIYRKAGSATSWTKIGTTKSTAFTDKKAKSGTTYKYCVRAVNSSVKSAFGGSSYKTIRFLSAPELETIKSTKSGITIYWDDVKGADGYIVYRKTGSGSYKKLAPVSGRTTVKYLDKSAKKGTTYSYKVCATYKSYTSSYNSSLSIKDKY